VTKRVIFQKPLSKNLINVGLLAILPLFVVALAPELIGDAYAQEVAPVIRITFKVIFAVNAGNQNIEDVQIVIESDKNFVWTIINGQFAHDSSINSVLIQAQDPTSITAIIVGYQVYD